MHAATCIYITTFFVQYKHEEKFATAPVGITPKSGPRGVKPVGIEAPTFPEAAGTTDACYLAGNVGP